MEPNGVAKGKGLPLNLYPDQSHGQSQSQSYPAFPSGSGSSLSGSEFALRVALCDLVERLKRSEQMCKYLELCRNELAKEVIRLRHENQVISRDYFATNQTLMRDVRSLSENRLPPGIGSNQTQLVPTAALSPNVDSPATGWRDHSDPKKKIGHELELFRNPCESDESWEEITTRLLKELRREMTGVFAPSPGGGTGAASFGAAVGLKRAAEILPPEERARGSRDLHLSDPSNVAQFSGQRISGNDQINSPSSDLTAEYEVQIQQIAINDNSSNLLSNSQEDYSMANRGESNGRAKSVIKVTAEASFGGNRGKINDVISKTNPFKMDPNKWEPGAGANASGAAIFEPPDGQSLGLCCQLLHSLSIDLDQMSNHLISQNDKLVKLKTKQLRSYFKRQLNDEQHHNLLLANPGKGEPRTHLEHV